MTLAEYLKPSKGRLSKADLAEKLNVSQITINRWCAGTRFPDKDMVLKIEWATSGKVKPADWYPPLTAEAFDEMIEQMTRPTRDGAHAQ